LIPTSPISSAGNTQIAKLQLLDVTLLIIDTQCHKLARLAVEDSMREVDFGDVIIFSDQPIHVSGARRAWLSRRPEAGRSPRRRL
jgi:hypothetical protein